MESDSFDLPVPTCTVETTLGGFSNCIFVHKLVISLFHLMAPKGTVTLRAEPLLSLSFIHGKNRLCTNLVHPLKSP